MRVLKFGGTSVADSAAISRVVSIVAARHGARTVVVSALAGVTDGLLEIAATAESDADAATASLESLIARHRVVAAGFRCDYARRMLDPAIEGIARGAAAVIRSHRRRRHDAGAGRTGWWRAGNCGAAVSSRPRLSRRDSRRSGSTRATSCGPTDGTAKRFLISTRPRRQCRAWCGRRSRSIASLSSAGSSAPGPTARRRRWGAAVRITPRR